MPHKDLKIRKEYLREWQRREHKRCHGYALRRAHGISIADYESLLLLQGNTCAICKTSQVGREGHQYLYVDHDHNTNMIRGLLCQACNLGLGKFKDSPELLRQAAQYLAG